MDSKEGKDLPAEDVVPEAKDFSDPVYKDLALMGGRINSMTKSELINNLKKLQLYPHGNVTVMRKRLKYHYKTRKLSSANISTVKKLYPFYVVIDFEATCESCNSDFPHEIIEFPACLVDTEKETIIDEFHCYVKPVLHPKLSDFCITLTGITQEMVDESEEFPEVLAKFEEWLAKHKLGTVHKYAIVTDGPCDMGRFLFGQCKISKIPFPLFAKKWINIRRIYSSYYRCQKISLTPMLLSFGVNFSGRLHSGLDDSRNIAKLMLLMIMDGVELEANESILTHEYVKKPLRNDAKRVRNTYQLNHRKKCHQQHLEQKREEKQSIDKEDLDFALGLMSVRNEVNNEISSEEIKVNSLVEQD